MHLGVFLFFFTSKGDAGKKQYPRSNRMLAVYERNECAVATFLYGLRILNMQRSLIAIITADLVELPENLRKAAEISLGIVST